jgi:hypothetical protein
MTEEALKRQRKRRKEDGNAATHKYEKTINGFLMRTYRNMLSRVTGIQHKKAHLYLGLSILTKDEFYSWAKRDEAFNELFSIWTKSEYNRLLTPSIDRIDSTKGYELDNIRWLTNSENSKGGALSKRRLQSA